LFFKFCYFVNGSCASNITYLLVQPRNNWKFDIVAWAIIRLLHKGILSSRFMDRAEDLRLQSSIVRVIKTVKVDNDPIVADAPNERTEKKVQS
jgi:hypothetical protein